MPKLDAVLCLVSFVALPVLASAQAASRPGRVVPPGAMSTANPKRVAAVSKRPRVEVAFVLDTTGSMGGLIEGAKRRIWSVARRIGEGQPRPDLRIALVAYRDKGDLYVTQVHDFTSDMDAVWGSPLHWMVSTARPFRRAACTARR